MSNESTRDPLTSLDSLEQEVELLAADASLARAWFEGVPAARLLSRVQLERTEHDPESWDALLEDLMGGERERIERLTRAVTKNLRAAQDEGPISGSDATVALLVLAASTSADASLGEIFGSPPHVHEDRELARKCAHYEPRIAAARSVRAASFEACVRLATKRSAGPWPQRRVLAAARALASSALGPFLETDGEARLYPHDVDGTHMVLVNRSRLEALARRDPMDLAKAVSALERSAGGPTGLDTLIADVAALLDVAGDIVLTTPPINPALTHPHPSAPPESDRPTSSMPLDWSHPDAASHIAAGIENGLVAYPRLRQWVARGGEPALDAIGAEMLNGPHHPHASAAFAEILAKSGRPRDVIRLVTYFAVTPDPLLAARVLGECEAPELPTVLRAWLEAMLPANGESPPPGDDPGTSSAARIAACVSSLEPYPHLYGAVRPLLSRVSVAPPASG